MYPRAQQQQEEVVVPNEMTGLANLGNTCFFNSICQVLAQTVPLVSYLTGEKSVLNGRVQGELSIALCVFFKLLERQRGKVFSPDKLWMFVCKKHEVFMSHVQQDAQELLIFMLVGLEDEYAKRELSQSAASDPSSPTDGDAKKKKKKKRKTNNIITKSFRGTFDNVVLCQSCKTRSIKGDDYFRDISVEVEPGPANTYHLKRLADFRAFEAKLPVVDDTPITDSAESPKTKHQRQTAHCIMEESQLRAKCAKDEAKLFDDILKQRKSTRADGVVACCVKGIEAYKSQFMEDGGGLVKCLASFFSPETMNGDNLYHCGKCKGKAPAGKQLSIASPPAILTIHVKRFLQDMMGNYRKMNGYVSFPLILVLDPFMSPDAAGSSAASSNIYSDSMFSRWGDNTEKVTAAANGLSDTSFLATSGSYVYRLYGVVVHEGTINYGHYYCYTRAFDPATNTRTDKWFRSSDSYVSEVSIFEVLASTAYLLMYERV